jgi:hypothetical protein
MEEWNMKKGYRLSSYTREMLKRYGSWEAGRYHYEVNAYPKIFGDPKNPSVADEVRYALLRNGEVIDWDFKF